MRGALSLKPSYYDALRRLTLELAGVRMGADHAFLVETRLADLARLEGYATLDAMIEELFSSGQTRLAVRVVSALVERDTHFNRDPASLDALFDVALEQTTRMRGGGTVDVLCYGCGSGQDVYSVAMRAANAPDALNGAGLRITGVDYPSQALERAQAGRYTHFEVQRGLAAKDLIRHFVPEPGDQSATEDWVVRPELRAMTSFREMHLLSGPEELGQFHVVAFRGSLVHYSAPAQVRVLRSLSKVLRPFGYLVLGAGESLGEMNFGLDPVPGQPNIYRKRDPGPPVDPSIKPSNGRTHFGPAESKRRRA